MGKPPSCYADSEEVYYDPRPALLLSELEKPANHKALAGTKKGEKTTGERKVAIYQRIGQTLFPEYYALEPRTIADRIKTRTEWLVSTYNKHAKRLQVTGGGIDNPAEDEADQDIPDQFMDFYIGAAGPNDETPDHAKNLWANIESDFPFFPQLHAIIGSRPNHIPPAVTTGVGPNGRRTVHYQAPDDDDDSTNDTEPSGVFASTDGQYRTLLDAIAAERAQRDSASGGEPTDTPSRNQENEAPPSTPASRPVSKRTSISEEAIAKVKGSIRKVAAKPTIEETLFRIQKSSMAALRKKEDARARMEKRQLLLEEFKLGIYTRDEYCVKAAELDSEKDGISARAESHLLGMRRRPLIEKIFDHICLNATISATSERRFVLSSTTPKT
ncbi:hypothetical protein HWV62_9911 [Athelia sp. TMB]|nr:hypothetical protein HWV62_9911 [Athelia sp. TMB]